MTRADRNGDGEVTRSEWVIARRRQWPFIWLWPAVGALVTCAIFVVGFRDRVPIAGEEHVGFDERRSIRPDGARPLTSRAQERVFDLLSFDRAAYCCTSRTGIMPRTMIKSVCSSERYVRRPIMPIGRPT